MEIQSSIVHITVTNNSVTNLPDEVYLNTDPKNVPEVSEHHQQMTYVSEIQVDLHGNQYPHHLLVLYNKYNSIATNILFKCTQTKDRTLFLWCPNICQTIPNHKIKDRFCELTPCTYNQANLIAERLLIVCNTKHETFTE